MGRAKRTREATYETPPGAATADGAPTAEGGGATRNVRGPASWSLRQSESLGAFRRAPVEVLNQIYECLDARGLGLLECASVGLEREARAAAAAEMARVVAPGGVVVLTDSIQSGDRPALDGRLENFENLNEPHYADYLSDDLAAHFLASPELRPGRKEVASTTKTLSFTREL